MSYGDRIAMLQKMAEREGKMPPALANRPVVTEHAAPYLTAFKRLHSSRMMGANGTPSGIPLSEMESYARMFGFGSPEDRLDLVHYVKICDDAWLTEVNKRRKPVGNPGKHTPGRRR
uniref:Uncharacterized protein n=1 Tax=Dinoroseobacter phage vB_DshS_R26L TaxID=3161158 RepID=A0AAU7VGH1_9CAUD